MDIECYRGRLVRLHSREDWGCILRSLSRGFLCLAAVAVSV